MAEEENWVMLEDPPPTEQQKLFDEAHKQMMERVARYDDRIVTVLKGHLAAEQSLNELLAAASRRWKRRTFEGKMDIAKGLFIKEMSEGWWAALKIANELRNAVAHGHKEGKINAKMADLRKAWIEANTPEQKKHIEGMDERQLVSSVFDQCGSHIAVATMRIEEENKRRKR